MSETNELKLSDSDIKRIADAVVCEMHARSAVDFVRFNKAQVPPYVRLPEIEAWIKDIEENRGGFSDRLRMVLGLK